MSFNPVNEKEVGQDTLTVLGPWGIYNLGNLDYFSRLPEGCLIEIHNFFNRCSSFAMENGFGFDLLVDCPDYPWNIGNYQYTIEASEEDGGFVEKRFTNRPVMIGSHARHNLKIPQIFITSLKELLRHHGVQTLIIDQMRVDGNFFSVLLDLLAGHKVNSLNMKGARCEEITDEDRMSLAHFINSVGLKKLHLEESTALNQFLNGQLFADLRGSNLKDIFTVTARQTDQSYKFYARRSDIPSMSRYSTLKSSFIVVDANWIVSMMIGYMDRLEDPLDCNGTWKLALRGHLTDAVINPQLVATRYEMKYGRVLHKRGTLMIARFEVTRRENEQLIEIRFDTTMNPHRGHNCM